MTVQLLKLVVASEAESPDDTAKPIYELDAINSLQFAVCFQLTPSVDWKALYVVPLRTNRTQTCFGAAAFAVTYEVLELEFKRRCEQKAPPEVYPIIVYLEPGVRLSRIITPTTAVLPA